MSATTANEAAVYIIFGGTGDLAARKLFPALAQSCMEGLLHERTQVMGLGRSHKSDEAFRGEIRPWLLQAKIPADHADKFLARLHYQTCGDKVDDIRALAGRLEAVCHANEIPRNYAFYLSLPPGAMPTTVSALGEVGLHKRNDGWTRVVLEKPFGTDLKTARELNHMVHQHFSEQQIYRIDHYLGKETVQNLLVFRLANNLIESAWNRDRIESVQITVGETLGVGSRAGYYDKSGAMRDMVQNHIAQVLTLAAMDVPQSFDAEAIRAEKIKILRSIEPIDLKKGVVRGQYTEAHFKGEHCKGYLQEANIPQTSQTETFIALELYINSWRWKGVPFYVRTGKRMPKKLTQIAVRFKDSPVTYFKGDDGKADSSDVLIITLQPNEGFSFHFDIKVPGDPFRLQRVPFRFRYNDKYPEMRESYQTLLLDVLRGDQTLFVHSEEVEQSWKLFMPILEQPSPCYPYAAGTWGPKEADRFAIPETELWQDAD